MENSGSVCGGASSPRGSGHRADRTNNFRPRHRSGGPQTSTEFFGKTTDMNSKIFDVGARQGDRFLSTQDEISKFASRNNLQGHQASNSIKALRPITYTEPLEPTFKDDSGSDLSDIK